MSAASLLGVTAEIAPADLELLFEHLSEGLILAEPSGLVVHWNRAARRMYGPTSPAAEADPVAAFIAAYELCQLDGEVLPLEQWPLRRLLRDGAIEPCELRVRRRDGTWERRFAYGGSTLRGVDGAPRLAVLRISDVTPQREAEAVASRELERQSLLLECARILLSAHDVTAEIIHKLYAHVRGHLRADVLFHYRHPDPGGPLVLVHGEGIPQRHAAAFARLPMGAAFCGLVAEQRSPLLADAARISCDERSTLLADMGVTAYACVPLMALDETLFGTLSFASTLRSSFEPDELRFLHTLSLLVALAIERSNARASLQASEQRFRQLSESLPQLVWTTTADGKCEFIGPQWEAFTGLPAQVALDGGWSLTFHPEDQPGVFARWREMLRAGLPTSDSFRMRRHDGQYRWVISSAVPQRDASGKVVKWVGSTTDVHELREAQDALAHREERLRLVLEQLPVVIWNTDRELRLTYVGGATYEALGFRNNGSVGRPLAHGPSSESPEVVERYRRALAGEQLRFERTRGTTVMRGVVGPLRDAAGATVGVIGMASDVTEQVLAQREIERLNADLERRVQERTAELCAANAELESFSYAVSHDLRAPLRAVSGFSQALVEDYGASLDAGAREMLDVINTASITMSELIDALLSLSRVTRCELRRDTLDLSAMCARVTAELRRAEPHHEVDVSIEPGMAARGDASLIEALLRNLIGNAWKYSSKVDAPSIRVFTEGDGEGLGAARTFCVADNGAGFSMDFAAKLFKPFQRLHRQDEFPGTGIGLATVQRIVQRHGGVVTAESHPGAGATFRFSLPFEPSAEEPA
jgi:PAS domain S-box-containing protein